MLTSTVYELLSEAERYALAGALGDRPETAMAVHALARGACRAYVRGTPARPRAAVVEIVGLLLTRPAICFPHPAVRRLGQSDVRLLESVPSELWAVGYATPAAALAGGYIAGAIVDDQGTGASSLVATAHAHGLVGQYAEIGVYTLPAWRRRGLGVAVASMVAQSLQEDGRIPVWSAGHDNAGSLRIAEKVGFEPAYGRCYVIRS